MSIRIGNRIISGGKGGNGDTISNQNPSSEITKLYNWVGTIEEYVQQEIATLHPDWVCYIVDGTQIAPSHRVIAFQKPTAENNYTWYRLYDDGWVEQGGRTPTGLNGVSVSLPIIMADTNYSISCTLKNSATSTSTGGFDRYPGAGVITTNGFWVDQPSNENYYTCWEVKGLYYQEEESGELLR